MKNIRLWKGDLQVRTHHFYNPYTERYFHLIGVCHMASYEFWKSTQAKVAELEEVYPGSEVHMEGIFHDVEKDLAMVSRHGHARLGRALRLPYQSEGLTYGKHWIRTDLTLSQALAKMKDPETFVKKLREGATASLEAADFIDGNKPWVRKLSRSLFRYGLALTALPFFKSPEQDVIIDIRNRHAVSTMLTSGTDIITLWGAGHLKGMTKILEGAGYTKISSQWNTCVPRKL